MAAGNESVEEPLAWEARWAPRAAAAAILGGLAAFAGTLVANSAVSGAPQVTINEGLADLADPASRNGLREDLLVHLDEHALGFTAGQIISALAAPLTALALIYLYRAIKARKPDLGRGALIALVVGGVAVLAGGTVRPVALALSISDFVGSSDHSTVAANEALQPSAAAAGAWIAAIGALSLGVGVILVALNAMRVGLLTRFMGILGVMAGAFMLLGMLNPAFQFPIVQMFWLLALGTLFLGKFPRGTPPAWETGRAEPWPSRQQMLEQQGKLPGPGTGAGKNAPLPPASDPVGSIAARPGHARSKKKKRRR